VCRERGVGVARGEYRSRSAQSRRANQGEPIELSPITASQSQCDNRNMPKPTTNPTEDKIKDQGSSVIHHPSSIIHHPSSIIRHPPNRPSTIGTIDHPSSAQSTIQSNPPVVNITQDPAGRADDERPRPRETKTSRYCDGRKEPPGNRMTG
jgi:hypothetical protein